MNFRKWPRTDAGTVLLHWVAIGAVVVLLLTGLRFTSDDVHHMWMHDLDGYLPSDNLWFRHMVAGFAFTVTAAGYGVYMTKGRLLDRIRLNAARLQGLFGNAKARWSCINVLLYWSFMVAAVGACVTGWLAYYGVAEPVLRIHLLCTWVIISFPAMHIVALIRVGGVPQVARIFRPKRSEPVAEDVDLASVVSDLLAEKRARQAALKTTERVL